MNKITQLESTIEKIGLTNLAELLTEHTGKVFSVQQVNNWRKRGIPYRWQDAVQSACNIPKSEMRHPQDAA